MRIIGSIIIPAFKSQRTIQRALDSISESVFPRSSIEVILVFDGPNEESEEIFRNWSASAHFQSKSEVTEHSGVSNARNLGAQIASGKNITFLDADDQITPARAKALTEEISRKIIIGKQEIVIAPELRYQEKLLHPSKHHLMSLVMNRDDFIRLGGFAAEYGVGSEWDFSIRARESGIELIKNDAIYLKRHIHTDNASHNNKAIKLEHLKAIREHLARSRD